MKSFERGNGLVGIRIHNLKNEIGKEAKKGPNPFDYLHFARIRGPKKILLHAKSSGSLSRYSEIPPIDEQNIPYNLGSMRAGYFSDIFLVYDWHLHDGYENFKTWIELAASQARR